MVFVYNHNICTTTGSSSLSLKKSFLILWCHGNIEVFSTSDSPIRCAIAVENQKFVDFRRGSGADRERICSLL